MNKRINKFVLAGIMTAGISCLSPLAFAIDKVSTSGVEADVESSLASSEDHNKQMDDLNREKELLELQGSLAKLKVEREKSAQELKKLRGIAVPEATASAGDPVAITASPDFAQMNPMQSFGGSMGQSQPQVRQKAVPDSPLDRVYVTRVYGVGGVRNVTVYFDNGIFTGAAGDEIVTGLRISKVTDNGAVFSYKGKTKSVNLTTQGLAYTRSQTKQKESSQQREVTAQGPSYPTMSGGFMSNMATEIGTGTNIPPPHPR